MTLTHKRQFSKKDDDIRSLKAVALRDFVQKNVNLFAKYNAKLNSIGQSAKQLKQTMDLLFKMQQDLYEAVYK